VSDATPRGASAADSEPRDERARGRELALLVLCHLESYPPEEHAEAVELLWRSPPSGEVDRGTLLSELVREAEVRQRADALVRGLLERWAEIERTISETSARWRIDRMAQVDRNVLRLAAFELAAQPNTPRPVVLAEAVRLARRYGSEQSAGFVNGVAEALALRLRGPREDGRGGKGSRTKRATPASTPKKEGAKGEAKEEDG
jgi:N utilization substance protein B